MNTNDPVNSDPLIITASSGNKFLQPKQPQQDTQSSEDAEAGDQVKVSKSVERLRALSTLRSSTAPRDTKLEKTADLPREQRLGEVKPLSQEDLAAAARVSGTYQKWSEAAKMQPHPWHRWFARHIDNLVFLFIVWVPQFFVRIAYAICGVDGFAMHAGVAVTGLLSVVAAIAYEPTMLSLFGTTIGKSVFNIKLREQRSGQYLSFGRALQRVMYVYWYAGFYVALVPAVGWIAPLIGQTMQYKKLLRDKITTYDEQLFVRYEHG